MSALTSLDHPGLRDRRSTGESTGATPKTAAVKQSAAAPKAAMKRGGIHRIAGAIFRIVAACMLVVAALMFVFLAIGPRVLGYQTSTMLTGSMAPLINPGDVVVTVPTSISDLQVGDVITYHIPVEDQRVETHRITDITPAADGQVAVQTKGDANNGVDPWIATLQGETVDKHVATIPYVGSAIRALREPVVLNALMYGAPAVLVVGMLASIWGTKPDGTPGASGTPGPSGTLGPSGTPGTTTDGTPGTTGREVSGDV